MKISKTKIDDFLSQLLVVGGALKPTTNDYEKFRMTLNDSLIVCYNSGSVVYDNSNNIQTVIERILIDQNESDYNIIIGSDESGKGEFIGPMVVATAAFKKENLSRLQSLGVKDSKKMSVNSIKNLVPIIKEYSEAFSIVNLMPEKFNELFLKFSQDGKNLNDLLTWMHQRAITNVLKDLGINRDVNKIKIIIDEFSKEKLDRKLFSVKKYPNVDVFQQTHAEEHVSVASASILARFYREMSLDQISKQYNVDIRSVSLESLRNLENADKILKTVYSKS